MGRNKFSIRKRWRIIALKVLYAKREKIYPAYVSKHNSNYEKQVILWITPNGEGGGTTAKPCSQTLPALLSRITSKNNGLFYCLNCLHSFRTKNKLELHKRVCENIIN